MSGVSKANQRQNKHHAAQHKIYKDRQRRESNKLKRMMRTLRKQPMNTELLKRLTELVKEMPLLARTLKTETLITEIHAERRQLT